MRVLSHRSSRHGNESLWPGSVGSAGTAQTSGRGRDRTARRTNLGPARAGRGGPRVLFELHFVAESGGDGANALERDGCTGNAGRGVPARSLGGRNVGRREAPGDDRTRIGAPAGNASAGRTKQCA